MKLSYLFLLLMLTGLVLGACRSNAAQPEGEEAAPEAVTEPRQLVCSTECSQRGQCGQNEAGQSVVLGHSVMPHTANHNMLFLVDQEVNMVNQQARQVRTRDNSQIPVNFYLLMTPNGEQAGWVAGWCVTLP